MPFQVLVSIIVFGMALVIGAYLFDMVNCWKCDELFRAESIKLREKLVSVGSEQGTSRGSVPLNIEELGPCFGGIQLRHLIKGEGGVIGCEQFCPEHPNSCWVMVSTSKCSGKNVIDECIDIDGNVNIEAEEELGLTVNPSSSELTILHSIYLIVERTEPNTISLRRPG